MLIGIITNSFTIGPIYESNLLFLVTISQKYSVIEKCNIKAHKIKQSFTFFKLKHKKNCYYIFLEIVLNTNFSIWTILFLLLLGSPSEIMTYLLGNVPYFVKVNYLI